MHNPHDRESDAGHEHRGGKAGHNHEGMVADFRRRFWVCFILTIPILAIDPMVQGFFGFEWIVPGYLYILFALGSVVYWYGGWPFITGLISEIRSKQPGMMTLIGLAISVAYFYSSAVVLGLPGHQLFWELATLIVIMLLGHWIEMRAVMGASRALEELVRLMPSEAHLVKDDGSVQDVPVSDLKKGDKVLVKPGEKIPTDGEIIEGGTSVNQAMLTGESQPVSKKKGDEVIGGSVNGEGSFTFRVGKTGDETYLSQVIGLVKQAQESRSKTQDVANRAALLLTIVALTVGIGTLVTWVLLGATFAFSIERMVTVMVIACPHALGLAVPLVVAVSTALAAGTGLLIRDRTAFENARDLQAIVFDKTGTLTEGRFGVTDVLAPGNLSEEEVLRIAASLEAHSEHPIATGIVAEAKERKIDFPGAKGFRAIAGKGAEAEVDGKTVRVVSPGYLKEKGIKSEQEEVSELRKQAKTVVFVLIDEEPVGAIALADVVREESKEALSKLKEMGIKSIMLTGDAQAVAEAVAKELEMDDFFAEVLPHEKSEKIKEVKSKGLRVSMVGDGVNDAPALVEADVGIAIGAGTDVAMEAADIVLVRSDPRDVPAIVALARSTYGKMVQNLWWAAGYNIVAIPLAAGVAIRYGILLTPAFGAVLMSASTVIVALNAQLLRRASKKLES